MRGPITWASVQHRGRWALALIPHPILYDRNNNNYYYRPRAVLTISRWCFRILEPCVHIIRSSLWWPDWARRERAETFGSGTLCHSTMYSTHNSTLFQSQVPCHRILSPLVVSILVDRVSSPPPRPVPSPMQQLHDVETSVAGRTPSVSDNSLIVETKARVQRTRTGCRTCRTRRVFYGPFSIFCPAIARLDARKSDLVLL